MPEIVLDHLAGCNLFPNFHHVLWVVNFSKQLLIIMWMCKSKEVEKLEVYEEN